MYKIGVIGSGPERFGKTDKVRRVIGYTIDLLGREYGEQDVVFNIKGEIGVAQWTVEECLSKELRYHLFMPHSLDKTGEHWYDEQKNKITDHYLKAYSLTICQPNSDGEDDAYKRLVDDSNFIVCFWVGNKFGQTADAIRYALSNSKIVLDGLDDLKLLTNQAVVKYKPWKKK